MDTRQGAFLAPSTCTWRATGAGGSATVTETMTTVAAPAAETVTYFHNDIAGTAQLATNASGVVVWKENYLPYGQRQAQPPASAGNRLWYTGKPHEEDTGLTYMGARYYMPLVGRFTGMDPKEFEPGQPHSLNRYAYGNNNPYKYVDPDGRSPVLVWALRGATVLVVAAANTTPEQRAQMARAGEQAAQSVADALVRVRNWVFNENAEGAGGEKDRESTLRPGPNAGDSIPARGSDRDFTPEERERINEIGNKTGCHTCGSKNPGTKSGNFVPDHQPPNALNPDGDPQRLYPHCLSCSRTQGGQVRGAGSGS